MKKGRPCTPMVVLAGACLMIGVFPRPVCRYGPQGRRSPCSLGYGRVPLEPFMQITGNITRGALLFFTVLVSIMVPCASFCTGANQ
jgi:hypothetical protein